MTTIATKPLKTDVMYINAEPMGFKLVNRLICNLSQGQRKDKEDQTDTLLYMPSVSLFVALRQTSEEESPTKAVCLPSGYFLFSFFFVCVFTSLCRLCQSQFSLFFCIASFSSASMRRAAETPVPSILKYFPPLYVKSQRPLLYITSLLIREHDFALARMNSFKKENL